MVALNTRLKNLKGSYGRGTGTVNAIQGADQPEPQAPPQAPSQAP